MRDISILVLFLIGCPSPTDSGDSGGADSAETGDSGDTAEPCGVPGDSAGSREAGVAPFADGDITCDAYWSETSIAPWTSGGGCGWGHVWLVHDDASLAMDLDLPDDDVEADTTFAYSLAVGAGAELELVEFGLGTEQADFWSCSDYLESFEGKVWTAVAGTVTVQTQWVCDTVDPWCDQEMSEHHALITLHDLGFQSNDECWEFPTPLGVKVTLGVSECGG